MVFAGLSGLGFFCLSKWEQQMPIYEYCCKRCNRRFENLAKSGDVSDSLVCPECDNRDVMRLPSVFGVGTSGIASAPTAEFPVCGACGQQTGQPCSQSET